MRFGILLLGVAVTISSPSAQQSAGFRLDEHVFNAGGRPQAGAVATSNGYRVSIDAVGDGLLPTAVAGTSFVVEGGFVSVYPPPGEVEGLFFSAADTLVWSPEESIGSYHLYRGTLDDLVGLAFGGCEQSHLPATQAIDAEVPSPGQGYHYLVTAENRLAEEGTKGFTSSGTTRGNPAPCP